MSKKAPDAEARMPNHSASAKYFGYDLNKLFNDLNDEEHILVAVSGGSDSVALLYLLSDWAKERNNLTLSVATIDHGLRKESAAEAEQVGLIAKKLGLRHVIEHWSGEKPDSALSQKAREVRYALLSKIAHDIGATAIALGHNSDDQRETVLMRTKRLGFSNFESEPDKSTNLGLAGMRPITSYCGPPYFKPVALVRPVLTIARAKLRLFLESTGEDWINDPSNEDDHYERVRVRKQLAAHPTKYPSAFQIGEFADDVAVLRQNLAYSCAQFMAECVWWQQCSGPDDGIVIIDRTAFEGWDKYLMRYLLRALIGVAGGRDFLISPDKAMQLTLNIQAGSMRRHTIGSAIIEPLKGQIRIWRENRNLPIINVSEAGDKVIAWDGRIIYRFSDEHLKQNLELKALGKDGVASIEAQLRQKFEAKPRPALFTQPAIFKADRPIFAPMLGWQTAGFAPPKWEYWSPALEQFQPNCELLLMDAISQLRYQF